MKKSETAELNFQLQARTELERNYKDTVFVTVFHEKEKLIELYNAIFDTDYDENTAIDIVTIKDVLFRTLKNDVSFVLDKRFVVLVEHQSTINGNLPLRDLLYMSTVLKRMINTKQLYREKILRIPRPAFIVLYNGPEDLPEYQELRLSDAYLGDKEETEEDALQLIVKVYNINTGKNAEILKKCETLRQYSRFVEIVRSYGHIDQLTSAVMVQIMDQCQEENVLTEFMEHYGAELIEMLFKELTREEDLEISRLDGYDVGQKDGFTKGEKSGFTKGETAGLAKGRSEGAAQKQQEIAEAGQHLALARRVLVVTDDGVPTQYARRVLDACEAAHGVGVLVTLPQGEASKTLANFEMLCRVMLLEEVFDQYGNANCVTWSLRSLTYFKMLHGL